MNHLCRLIGPSGVKLIEERIMKGIGQIATEIKETLGVNREALEIIRNSWTDAAKCQEAFRKLKGSEPILDKTAAVGVLLAFRSNLAEALAKTLESRVPHIFNTINDAHRQYPANLFGMGGYSEVDELANWAGIFDNVDTVLRKCFLPLCGIFFFFFFFLSLFSFFFLFIKKKLN